MLVREAIDVIISVKFLLRRQCCLPLQSQMVPILDNIYLLVDFLNKISLRPQNSLLPPVKYILGILQPLDSLTSSKVINNKINFAL